MSSQPKIDIRIKESSQATELYLTATPGSADDPRGQARAIFAAAAECLRRHDARIVQERFFATADSMDMLAAERAGAYGALDDGIKPTALVVPAGACGPVAGVHVHAVAGCPPPHVLSLGAAACGRMIRCGSLCYVAGNNLQADQPGSPARQAQAMLEKTEAILKSVGGNLFQVARTWMWLGGILNWYGEFNRVRNEFFIERGLLKKGNGSRLPASTGIGIGPAGGRPCAMDFCGVLEGGAIECLLAGGNQGAASSYGSAFSRAAAAPTPAGKTVYVSGTAAIASDGKTTHVGDARGQIADTIGNVLAVFHQAGCTESDIVQAIVYCKTPKVEEIFRAGWPDLSWPHIVAIADVCRDDLLFEIEATAMPGASNRQ